MEESMLTGAGDGEVVVNSTHNPNSLRFETPNSRNQIELTALSFKNSSILTGIGGQNVISTGDEEQNIIDLSPLEFESPNSGYQAEVTASSIDNSNIVTGIGSQITGLSGDEEMNTTYPSPRELHDYSDPKDSAYLLRLYPTFIGVVAGKFLWEKHPPIPATKPFIIISGIVYAMAYLNLVILFCMYDGHQRFSPGQYMITKYVFYILCLLAPFSLLPLLFIP